MEESAPYHTQNIQTYVINSLIDTNALIDGRNQGFARYKRSIRVRGTSKCGHLKEFKKIC
jgi:hypothetical protein